MLAITLADLRYRLRQFLIAIIGAGLVFAMALLLSGMVSGFYNEIDRTVDSVDADGWILPEGSAGPFTSLRGLPEAEVQKVRGIRGVESAYGMAISLQSTDRGDSEPTRLMMIGVGPKSPQPEPDEGRTVTKRGEALVDERTEYEVGDEFRLGDRPFEVVGVVSGMTMLGGTPDVWVSLRSAQDVLFGGQPLVTTIAIQGEPKRVPEGLIVLDNSSVEEDSFGPMEPAVESINNTRYLMWATATIIIAALVYVSALQRTRDFAVMKAVGASSRLLFLGLAVQSVIVSLAAAALAEVTSFLLKPLMAIPVEVSLNSFLILPVVAVVVGLVSSLVAMRRAVRVDPALAFGSG